MSNFSQALKNTVHEPSDLDEAILVAILQEEANKLSQCIHRRLKKYYVNNPPERYTRRENGLLNSIIVTDVRSESVGGETYFYIEVTFDSKKMLSKSYWDDTSVSNPAVLISEGWEVKKNVWFKNIYRFGKFSGADFIEDGIRDYLSMQGAISAPIVVTRFSPNNYQKGKTYR